MGSLSGAGRLLTGGSDQGGLSGHVSCEGHVVKTVMGVLMMMGM